MLAKYKPKWFIWENVPGVLSSSGGRDFGSFLGAVAELGYGFSYRVLDAQYFGVAQRRRRVFVVGHLGDWRAPFEVLALSEGMSGHPKPSREAREASSPVSTHRLVAFGEYAEDGTASTVKARDYKDATDLITTVYENHGTDSRIKEVDVCPTVTARWGTGGNNVPLAHAFKIRGGCEGGGKGYLGSDELTFTLSTTHDQDLFHGSTVRRLSPIECERLQGFPDDYTLIPWRKAQSPDSARYKAMGNSMAVPVMNWIGTRINNWEKQNA
jgi:DNA (cytosine-5)-methyltransferase 1